MFRVAAKLKNVKKHIKIQNKTTFGNIFQNKTKILEELKDIQNNIQANGYEMVTREEESNKLVELHDLISKEETFWRQCSRKKFLKEGDRNTKFFHMTTLKHRMANRISKLMMTDGMANNEDFIKKEARVFFGSLLQCDPNLNMEKQQMVFNNIPLCIFEA